MKKYMFVVHALSGGGAERVVSVLSSGLAEHGCDITVLCFYKAENEYMISDKVRKVYLVDGCFDDFLKLNKIERFRRIHNFFKKYNPDKIICFLHQAIFYALLSAGKYINRIVYTERNNPYIETKCFSKRLFDFLVNHTNMTLVQNNEQKQYFKKSAHKRIFVLSNPVDEKFLQINREKGENENYIVVAVGRLNKQKNFSMLINAFSTFAKDKEKVTLNIYGSGLEQQRLQNLINDLKQNEKISLMGKSNDMPQVLSNADLFILSSNFEGMPNALLEAMAVGVPCITTNCKTGPKEMVENEKNGLLIPVDDENKMVEAINYMYFNLEAASKMGENAREKVKKYYTLENIINVFFEIFKD